MKKDWYEYRTKGISYTHKDLKDGVEQLQNKYRFLDKITIGKSVENRGIYVVKFGQGPRKVFISGGTHSCEWITVPILIKCLEKFSFLYSKNAILDNISIERLFNINTVYFLPMLNPDGIELQAKGISNWHSNYKRLVKWNNGSTDFTKWKSNINGIDLNRNFDANWEESKKIEKQLGIQGPWFEVYGGKHPECQPETKAICSYTREENFDVVLSYHTQGREIYWDFDNFQIEGARELGEKLARSSGYKLSKPSKNSSYAGYKDWFIKEFKKPGYTIECGLGENPLPLSQFNEIYEENFRLILTAMLG